ncbi:MAG: 30S ribosomal protein S16 [Candidatus Omnitrophica bacterium]|nr:30S ribosomal protein S16 [Candidatus Omnitrophota bacterium]
MAVVIRLKRMGANKKPFSRIVVTDSRSPRDGRFIEEIGHYDMRKSPAVVKIDKERAEYWVKKGARPSETVKSFFKKEKIAC